MDSHFAEYLEAKRSVDDRALNPEVWRRLEEQAAQTGPGPYRIWELGCGSGTMVERLASRGLWKSVEYHGVDRDPDLLDRLWERLPPLPGWKVEVHEADVRSVMADIPDRGPDLVLAHAFLDLLDIEKDLPPFLKALPPSTLVWFTINYNGDTSFWPSDPRDPVVLEAYHGTMDHPLESGRRRSGRTSGRRILEALLNASCDVLAAGPSDWMVCPRAGAYPDREDRFLEAILQFFEGALTGILDSGVLAPWLESRRAQIQAGSLFFQARNLDVLGRTRG